MKLHVAKGGGGGGEGEGGGGGLAEESGEAAEEGAGVAEAEAQAGEIVDGDGGRGGGEVVDEVEDRTEVLLAADDGVESAVLDPFKLGVDEGLSVVEVVPPAAAGEAEVLMLCGSPQHISEYCPIRQSSGGVREKEEV